MKRIELSLKVAALAAALFLSNGCVTVPASNDAAVSAYKVGDRSGTTLDEIVVSLPLLGTSETYQNLHISLTIFANPVKASFSTEYDLRDIVRRLEPRIAAKLTESLSGADQQSLHTSDQLRAKILSETKPIVDQAMRQWEHGSDYQVEVAVAGLYWTDRSVGRVISNRSGWWF